MDCVLMTSFLYVCSEPDGADLIYCTESKQTAKIKGKKTDIA